MTALFYTLLDCHPIFRVQNWCGTRKKQRPTFCSLHGMAGVRAGELTYHSPVISSISANLCANKRQSSKSKCHRSIHYKEIFIFESELTRHVRGRRHQNYTTLKHFSWNRRQFCIHPSCIVKYHWTYVKWWYYLNINYKIILK